MQTITRPPTPARQKGKALDHHGLQEALDSSPDVVKKGTGQFFTPKEYAKVFTMALTPVRPTVFDPHTGQHNLLAAAMTSHTRDLLGVDLDNRSRSSNVRTIIADLNRLFPLMREVGLRFDLLVMNPPFGLRWPAPEIQIKHRRPVRPVDGMLMMDSVQASWLMALELLTEYGEGLMIAPQPVVEKLIQPCPSYSRVWAHVTLPQFFPNVRDQREMAVLYFAAQHSNRGKPRRIQLQSAALPIVHRAMRQLANQRSLWLGKTLRVDAGSRYLRDEQTPRLFEVVRGEWLARQQNNRPKFNIWLDRHQRIQTYLSSFEEESRNLDRDLVQALHNLRNRRPVELVLTKSERLALLHTVKDAGWKVDPNLILAVEQAVADYHRCRVPFNKPTLAMRVAWAEEEDKLTAANDWHSFRAGESYALSSDTFTGRKLEFREHPEFGEEEVLVSGRELMICLTDQRGIRHGFTQYPIDRQTIKEDYDKDDETIRTLMRVQHFHSLRDLMQNFHMPDVPDIREVSPDLYNHYRQKLRALERD